MNQLNLPIQLYAYNLSDDTAPNKTWSSTAQICAPFRILTVVLLFISQLIFCCHVMGEDADGVRLRFTWGGSTAETWSGRITFPDEVKLGPLRILGMEPDQSGRIYKFGNSVFVDQRIATVYSGFEVEVTGDLSKEMLVDLATSNAAAKPSQPSIRQSLILNRVLGGPINATIAGSEQRIFISEAPGNKIKFRSATRSLVFDPGEQIDFSIAFGKHCGLEPDEKRQMKLVIRKLADRKSSIWTTTRSMKVSSGFEDLQISAPDEAGAYEIDLQVLEPSRIPFNIGKVIFRRTVEFVVTSAHPINRTIDVPENLELVFTGEPGKSEWSFQNIGKKQLKKINKRARDLFLKYLPLPIGSMAELDQLSIGPGEWRVFPVALDEAQQLHRIDVEFENPNSGDLDVLILDRQTPEAQWQVLTGRSLEPDSESRQRLLTWSYSKSPLILVNNRSDKTAATINRIQAFRVKSGENSYNFRSVQSRQLFSQFSPLQFTTELAVPKSMQDGFPLDSWHTFFVGSQRLIRVLKNGGFQGVVLDVNPEGSTLFPSEVLQSTPRLDTGIFSSSASDPLSKDVLELLFREFNRNQLTLIPRIELPESVASLEALKESLPATEAENIYLSTANGEISGTYNILDKNVQKVITKLALEISQRYSHHPSFGGLSLRLGKNRQLTLIDEKWAYSPETVKDFLKMSNTQLASKEDGPDQNAELNDSQRVAYNAWRQKQLTEFLVDVDELVTNVSGKKLLLDTSEMALAEETRNRHFPSLREGSAVADPFTPKGISRKDLAAKNVAPFLPVVRGPGMGLSRKRIEFAFDEWQNALESETEQDVFIQRVVLPRTELLKQRLNLEAAPIAAYQGIYSDSNQLLRQDLTTQLAKRDCLLILDSNQVLARALDTPTREICEIFTQLPNTPFENVTRTQGFSPIVIRKKSMGKKSYIYIVNQSPWPARVTIDFSTPLVNLRKVNGGFFSQLAKNETGGVLVLELRPFDLVAGESDQEKLEVSNVQIALPENLASELSTDKDKLLALIRFLPEPQSDSQLVNPSFESEPIDGTPHPWNVAESKTFSTKLNRNATDGKQSLSLTNSTKDVWGWIRSDDLKTPTTGRLSLVVSMKKSGGPCPQVRLSIEGKQNGRDYYRFGTFSTEPESEDASRITDQWKPFAVHFNDVPDDLTNLRVGIDVYGEGTVYVDHFRVFDRWFDAQDQEALSKIVTLAGHKVTEGELLQANHLLKSYWPTFIRKHFAQSKRLTEKTGSESPETSSPKQ